MDAIASTAGSTEHGRTRADVDEDSLIDLRQVGRIIRRRAKVIVIITAAALAMALIAYLLAERRYTAVAQVALDLSAEQVIAVDQVTPAVEPDSAAVDTEVQVLRSPELAGRVVDALRLDRDPEFNPAIGESAPPPSDRVDPQGRGRAVSTLLSNLDVNREGLSYAITVAYESPSATTAARIANAVVQQYVAGQVGTKSAATARANDFLSDRLAEMRAQVLAADTAVQRYRAENNLFAASDVSTVTQEELSSLSTQLAQARAEQAAAQARLSSARAQLNRGRSGEELGEALDSPVVSQLRAQRAEASREVAALRERYGERHPDLQRATEALRDTDAQIAAEVRRIVANVSIQANVANQRTGSLAGSLGQAQGQLAADNAASVRLAELERNAESAKTLYQAFLDRYKQTSAQQGLERSDSYIVTGARVPGAPSSPNPLMYIALALVAALAGSTGAVLLLQMLERGLETSEAVERRLDVPALASIPDPATLPDYRRTGVPAPLIDLVAARPQSLFAESFRSLRTSIQFARGEGPTVVAVTSALPGEGKTTTAICLARSAALAGTRALLVDCDPRRRASSRAFNLGKRPGLMEVLAGSAPVDEALARDEASGAFVLAQRSEVSAGKQLGEHAQLGVLLDKLRERFDLIVLDTAPVIPVDEARVIASLADGVILLVRWRKTPAKAAELALRQLADVRANVLGAALTRVDVAEQARSGFGDAGYYFNEYKSYHTA